MESISFDRAAEYYDRTRSLSDDANRAMADLLAKELAGHRLALEIGVGTGRIALPLVERGLGVVGVDLSQKMLAMLRTKTSAVPAVAGDATRLPFGDDVFDAGIACHVLHLIPDWPAAVHELARVVRPGGRLLINLGGWDQGVWQEIEKRFVTEAGISNPRPGARDAGPVDEVLASLGATARVLPEITDHRRLTYGELIDRIESGMYSFTWSANEDARRRGAAAVREWLLAEHGALDVEHDKLWIVSWRAYDLP
ncbi:MAG TPA: methyltransferase domain-containing protein [Actinomycetota bacterium]